MALYLGLDCSTQSLTAIVIEVGSDGQARQVFHDNLEFDRDLPHWETSHGVSPSDDGSVQMAPPGLWAEALDVVIGRVAGAGLDLSRLRAIAGSGQQHGSVYLGGQAGSVMAALAPERPLVGQLAPIYTRDESPIWMDTSTTTECSEIQSALGGPEATSALTGSRAVERFTGPQIRKFWKTEPDAFEATDRVHLVSSFLATLLLGQHAPLEPGDASGMNLMDIRSRAWAPKALAATAPGLEGKLPPIVPSASVIGSLSAYWQQRHGLPAARLVAWTGDNPSSLIGTGLVDEGVVAVSLGTSDTIFGLMKAPRIDQSGAGHVFGSPTGDWMGLTCFRNGSLARERVRNDCGLDWHGFASALSDSEPGNDGALMLPWFDPEITPSAPAGAHYENLDLADVPARVRAVVEGQMLAMARHSRWMGVDVRRIRATGGASVNDAILQVMADVFQAEVERFDAANSACLGAALRAWHADAAASGTPVEWAQVVEVTSRTVRSIGPRPQFAAVYQGAARRAVRLERSALTARPLAAP